MKRTFCFIAVASLSLTIVSYCKNDKLEVEEESGQKSVIQPLPNRQLP